MRLLAKGIGISCQNIREITVVLNKKWPSQLMLYFIESASALNNSMLKNVYSI